MRSKFVTPQIYADAVMEIIDSGCFVSEKKPESFKKIMRQSRSVIDMFNPFGPAGDGMERKNPVVVALGDSVTAGHFELFGDLSAEIEITDVGVEKAGEIVDVRSSYVEQFRDMLIDRYLITAVSTINAGIAGDTIYGMQKRLYRDVIRYQPDLVLINGSLNWGPECGSTEEYRRVLTEVVRTIKNETKADIILLTPNMDQMPTEMPKNPVSNLKDRVDAIRQISAQEDTCLADAYKVWEVYQEKGYPIVELLANGTNHPSIIGHTLYAKVLMQLIL